MGVISLNLMLCVDDFFLRTGVECILSELSWNDNVEVYNGKPINKFYDAIILDMTNFSKYKNHYINTKKIYVFYKRDELFMIRKVTNCNNVSFLYMGDQLHLVKGILNKLICDYRSYKTQKHDETETLSRIEIEIIYLFLKELPVYKISIIMNMDKKKISAKKRSAMKKLGVNNNYELIRKLNNESIIQLVI